MSEDKKSRGQTAAVWWNSHMGQSEAKGTRGLAARLRRAGDVEALCEPAVHDLAQKLGMNAYQGKKLAGLARLLAEVREYDRAPLAARLGGKDPAMSKTRFQRLMRASEDELDAHLRRALAMVNYQCNVAALASDYLNWHDDRWGETTRTRWCFQYFGAVVPASSSLETI